MAAERIIATYFVETPYPVEIAAEAIAGEQSSGTFLPVPGETEELKKRFRARVEKITHLETVDKPSLPGVRLAKGHAGPAKYHRAHVIVSYPLENVGANLPTLLSTVAGNLYELGELSGLKLVDVEIPDTFGQRYPGPQFGIAGTRKLAGVFDRPIIGT